MNKNVFKIVIKLLQNNKKHLQVFKEHATQEIATLKQHQAELLEMKQTRQQIKNSVESRNNRMNEVEEYQKWKTPSIITPKQSKARRELNQTKKSTQD